MYSVRWLQDERIKQVVRDTVNNELFWHELFSKTLVCGLVEENVPRVVKRQLTVLLPSLLAKEVPVFLSQNVQMQQILESHTLQLTGELETSARAHLKRVVSDPEFHEINKEFFSAISSQSQETMRDIRVDGDKAIQEMRADCDAKLSTFNRLTIRLEQAEQDRAALRKDIDTAHTRITVLTWSAVAAGLGLWYSLSQDS